MIEFRRCPRDEACMAGVALRRGGNVRRWLRLRVLCQVATAVTAYALSVEACVVHRRGRKGNCAFMARIAGAGGGNMFWVLPSRAGEKVRPIVAGHALPDASVIHRRRRESGEALVAGVALRGGGYVIGWLRQSFAARHVTR